MSSQATEPLELQVWTEMRSCRTCWQGALVVGRLPGGARCTGGSLPCGLWWGHEKKEVMSPERLRYFSRLTEIYGKLLPELSLFTVAKSVSQFTGAVELQVALWVFNVKQMI